MSFGVEEQKFPLPYVETQHIVKGIVTEYPKHKFHPKIEGSVVVKSREEEEALPEGFVDSPAEFGVETCPGIEKSDPVNLQLAALRAAEAKKTSKSKAAE